MAYMSQEHKARIAAKLKPIIPKDWKWSLAVYHHSTIVLTISAAPVDLIQAHKEPEWYELNRRHMTIEEWRRQLGTYLQLNEYYLDKAYEGELLEVFHNIKTALNDGNWDRSDSQRDHFDVGHYVQINIGKWDKPFQVLAKAAQPTYEQLKARLAELEAK